MIMSVIDKVLNAVSPAESDKAHAEARSNAMAVARAGDWLSQVVTHHRQLETAFGQVKVTANAAERRAAQKWLGVLLTGHSIAEESVIYPALALHHEKGRAEHGFTEQATVKTQMAELETLEPMSQDYAEKLEHIRAAVAHHMLEEEGKWFVDLHRKLSVAEHGKLTQRYQEEFERYVGQDRAA
jgi:hypothetical protein